MFSISDLVEFTKVWATALKRARGFKTRKACDEMTAST